MDCEWTEWKIGHCSASVSGGRRIKTRTKTVEESNGGICTGKAWELEDCTLKNLQGNSNMYPIYLLYDFNVCAH